MQRKPFLTLALILLLSGSMLASPPKEFRNWPSGASPVEVGNRVAGRFVSTVKLNKETAIYPAICTWYGALTFAELTHNKHLLQQLTELFDQQFTADLKAFALARHHVDYSVSGSVPLEIYIASKNSQYLSVGLEFADSQWESPNPDELSRETRYWIDDMFMITILQVQAYRATGDSRYLDRAAREMISYLDRLQQPNGLFYHAPDAPFFWGRGNGWVAAGMTELLRSIPRDNPQRARIMSAYLSMMQSLLRLQGNDGMWRQLLDHSDSWPESSSTGMFTYAMITGVKNGWLEEKVYGRAARKAWLAMVGQLEPNGDIRNVCEGTGRKNDLDYYLQRKRNTGDLHGQAPILWCASALLR